MGHALRVATARARVQVMVVHDFERAAWRRRPDGELSRQRISRSALRELARGSKLLAQELGAELEVVDRASEPAAWDEFLAMEHSSWKGEAGTSMLSNEADAAFFRQMCAEMAAAGRLELLVLEGGGRAVAMLSHLVDRDVLYSFKAAYAPEFRKFRKSGPGTQLQYRAIERFQDQRLLLADSLSDPQNAHQNRIWPDRRRMQVLILQTGALSAYLLPPGLWAEAVFRRIRGEIARRRSDLGVGEPAAQLGMTQLVVPVRSSPTEARCRVAQVSLGRGNRSVLVQ